MHISMHPLLLSTSHFGQTISFVSLRGLDYLIFRESTPLPRPPILSQTLKFHTPFCGTKHFHIHRVHLHYSTTFHDLLGAFLPCLVRPWFTAYCTLLFFLAPENGVSDTPPSNTLYQLFLDEFMYMAGRDLWSSFFALSAAERGEERSAPYLSRDWETLRSMYDSCLRRGSRSA